jgi:hypothetical protein
MRLSDVIGGMGLSVFPIVGLLIFLGVFTAVTVRALRLRRSDVTRFAGLPLDGGEAGESNNRERNHV